ncbi:histidinol phosphate aminotransferase, partial [Porphyromonas gingivalis]
MLFFKRRQSCIAHKATGKKLWYPQTVINGSTASTLHIAEQISELSGASPGDVFGILRDLGIVMRRELASGKKIKLDGIGCFRLIAQAKGSGVEKKEDVKASQFNSVRVNFRA